MEKLIPHSNHFSGRVFKFSRCLARPSDAETTDDQTLEMWSRQGGPDPTFHFDHPDMILDPGIGKPPDEFKAVMRDRRRQAASDFSPQRIYTFSSPVLGPSNDEKMEGEEAVLKWKDGGLLP
ncbi:uncharacterized protein PAC_12442 [Phialocephala subalpina]|uniref:Uncharacterized protein n=1 Tax=Phialocephala subalpina TaxID=576137 RepID=A0A1L7XC10_9HELO|nr:uncharacterized protein PAC_12442 [Phialocephala subalpina]